jgi:hypothetical protein
MLTRIKHLQHINSIHQRAEKCFGMWEESDFWERSVKDKYTDFRLANAYLDLFRFIQSKLRNVVQFGTFSMKWAITFCVIYCSEI